jgi:hypothetical protein
MLELILFLVEVSVEIRNIFRADGFPDRLILFFPGELTLELDGVGFLARNVCGLGCGSEDPRRVKAVASWRSAATIAVVASRRI